MNVSIAQMYNQLLSSDCSPVEVDDIIAEEQEFERIGRQEIEHERQREAEEKA